ncbi:ATP-binding cassette domain-containing protein [Gordonia sp. ABSL11-1]|uniref:ATP-binding cassette domain-containing protein n=1 Tax=Gordonia sp. ABSL11-1 TaxID=3053924 RepID=UPI00257474C6|nr:ATP-binding cassette domain-containing protein [Gordonia sp. ABSL11-1]MDL9947646.1 ATP-binding cassette domain-containing protein [Gordonia sp. ABSL11-1]
MVAAPPAAGVTVAGAVKAVEGMRILDDVSFTAAAGRITALLGPNGAGKTTILRAMLGLVRLDAGAVLVGGQPPGRAGDPARTVGAALSIEGLHPARTATGHLRIVAAATGVSADRIRDVLEVVGLSSTARLRVGQMSLGMRQRLALATALLADPQVLILDEPHNGLDAEAIRWLRHVLRRFADAGRTVLISSHLLAELQCSADEVVVLDRGRVVAQCAVADVAGAGAGPDALENWYFDRVGAAR